MGDSGLNPANFYDVVNLSPNTTRKQTSASWWRGQALATFAKQREKRDWKEAGELATSDFRVERTDGVYLEPGNP